MKETEHQCCSCKRYLTLEEVEKNKQLKKIISESRCFYCILDTVEMINNISDEKYPVPVPEEYGRNSQTVLAETKNEIAQEAPTTSGLTEAWHPDTAKYFDTEHNTEFDPNQPIETTRFQPKPKAKTKKTDSVEIRKVLTQISAMGTSEDVSLVFTVPRELLDPRLGPVIQGGLNNILMSLMSMLTYAPLHNGVMENILKPPSPNPFGFGPTNNLFGE